MKKILIFGCGEISDAISEIIMFEIQKPEITKNTSTPSQPPFIKSKST